MLYTLIDGQDEQDGLDEEEFKEVLLDLVNSNDTVTIHYRGLVDAGAQKSFELL